MTALLLLLALQQQYLLMQPIQESLQSGDFAPLQAICREYVAVNLEEPLAIRGYLSRERFCRALSGRIGSFQVDSLEWAAIQVGDDRAVQSLDLRLRNRSSGQRVTIKLIFFMSKGKEWRLDYLRGLRM